MGNQASRVIRILMWFSAKFITRSRGDYIGGQAGNDVIYGMGGVNDLWGSNGADQLFGGDDNDHLSGDSGFCITGGSCLPLDSGHDTLYGGAGNDTYQFTESWGVDAIPFDPSGFDMVDFFGTTPNYGNALRAPVTVDLAAGHAISRP